MLFYALKTAKMELSLPTLHLSAKAQMKGDAEARSYFLLVDDFTAELEAILDGGPDEGGAVIVRTARFVRQPFFQLVSGGGKGVAASGSRVGGHLNNNHDRSFDAVFHRLTGAVLSASMKLPLGKLEVEHPMQKVSFATHRGSN